MNTIVLPLGKAPADVYGRCLRSCCGPFKPGRCKTLPGLAQSFGAILDALELQEIVATICGDDVCLVICEDNQGALDYLKIKRIPPTFLVIKVWKPSFQTFMWWLKCWLNGFLDTVYQQRIETGQFVARSLAWCSVCSAPGKEPQKRHLPPWSGA